MSKIRKTAKLSWCPITTTDPRLSRFPPILLELKYRIQMIFQTCGDQTTCLALVNILSEIAAGTGLKRLVNHDVTRVLLHTVAYLGKEADNRLLSALLGLSVKIAPKGV